MLIILVTLNIVLLLLLLVLGSVAFHLLKRHLTRIESQTYDNGEATEKKLSGLLLCLSDKEEEETRRFRAATAAVQKLEEDIKELQSGLVPDYEEAKRANEEINRFTTGVGNILGFDPFDAVKQRREGGDKK